MDLNQDDPALATVSCLNDPVRGRLYAAVTGRPEPVSRDEAAAAAGVGRAIAVYHLDKLVQAGLLSASYRRPEGRGGPGAGRPAKYYARSSVEFSVTVPPREYELAADLLAQAVAADPDGACRVALGAAARRFGAAAGAGLRSASPQAGPPGLVTEALRAHGFEPGPDQDAIVLRNCPFHRLAGQHREVVCGMNLALIDGLLTGLGADGMRPELAPGPGRCCVVIRAGQPPAETATAGAR
jgi:predicted ArsR family transcriptional regulator